ncbi:MAG: hypothetical protein P8Z41_02470 [Anaerolineales bacterium]
MKLSAPKQITWLISVVLIVVGIVAEFVDLSIVTQYNFWIMTVAAVLLALATSLKGLKVADRVRASRCTVGPDDSWSAPTYLFEQALATNDRGQRFLFFVIQRSDGVIRFAMNFTRPHFL